jgi:hypothetical protein
LQPRALLRRAQRQLLFPYERRAEPAIQRVLIFKKEVEVRRAHEVELELAEGTVRCSGLGFAEQEQFVKAFYKPRAPKLVVIRRDDFEGVLSAPSESSA